MTCAEGLLMCQYPGVLQRGPPHLEQVHTAVIVKLAQESSLCMVLLKFLAVSKRHILMLKQELMQGMPMTLRRGGQA